jgi:hypothetical protein
VISIEATKANAVLTHGLSRFFFSLHVETLQPVCTIYAKTQTQISEDDVRKFAVMTWTHDLGI